MFKLNDIMQEDMFCENIINSMRAKSLELDSIEIRRRELIIDNVMIDISYMLQEEFAKDFYAFIFFSYTHSRTQKYTDILAKGNIYEYFKELGITSKYCVGRYKQANIKLERIYTVFIPKREIEYFRTATSRNLKELAVKAVEDICKNENVVKAYHTYFNSRAKRGVDKIFEVNELFKEQYIDIFKIYDGSIDIVLISLMNVLYDYKNIAETTGDILLEQMIKNLVVYYKSNLVMLSLVGDYLSRGCKDTRYTSELNGDVYKLSILSNHNNNIMFVKNIFK